MSLSTDHKLQVWHRAIETQMHFAELSIKMRQIGLTLAGATIALAVVLYRTDTDFSIRIQSLDLLLPVGTILCASAALILFAARTVDVGVYHKMLRGAVKFNELYEMRHDHDFEWDSGLTETISAYSRYGKPMLMTERDEEGNKWRDEQCSWLASTRINVFYWISIFGLIFAGTMLAIAENSANVIVK